MLITEAGDSKADIHYRFSRAKPTRPFRKSSSKTWRCSCRNIHLFFVPLRDEDDLLHRPIDSTHESHVIFDLKSKRWRVEKDDENLPVRPEELIATLRRTHPATRIYSERHRTLRALYRKHYKERAREKVADSGLADAPRRVGRNEPCPCGSGKKYKRCCMPKG